MDEKRFIKKNQWRGLLVSWAVLTVLWFVLQAVNLLYVVISKPGWLHDPQFVPLGVAVALLPPLLLLIVFVALHLAGFKGGRR